MLIQPNNDRFPKEPRNLAVCDFGVFVVGSTSESGKHHRINVSYVPRIGPVVTEPPWGWDTAGCPAETVQTVELRCDTFLADAILHCYGIANGLPF
jgi:hypothetical protein